MSALKMTKVGPFVFAYRWSSDGKWRVEGKVRRLALVPLSHPDHQTFAGVTMICWGLALHIGLDTDFL